MDSASPTSLSAAVLAEMDAQIDALAARTVTTINDEVHEYRAQAGGLAPGTERAVALALRSFVHVLRRPDGGTDAPTEATSAAYELGRAEGRAGRTMEALLAAFRVGARLAWREWGAIVVEHRVDPAQTVRLAELLFDFIDQLSAASAAGHTAERGARLRQRDLQLVRLGQALLSGEAPDRLTHLAARAQWTPPPSLTAVLVLGGQASTVRQLFDSATLHVAFEELGAEAAPEVDVLLVPSTDRPALLAALRGRHVVVGPQREWSDVASSYARALRTIRVRDLVVGAGLVDTADHLPELVLTADPDALAELQHRALAPFEELPPATRQRLTETLRSWLLHQGRRDPMAADLGVHPQTVRYRVAQLRELFGDALREPESVLALTLAVGVRPRGAVVHHA